MKTITIITEQVSGRELAAALPAEGVQTYTVARGRSLSRSSVAEGLRSFRNPNRFAPNYRVDLMVDDDAVEAVFESISIAYGAGFFSDSEVWVNAPALALSA